MKRMLLIVLTVWIGGCHSTMRPQGAQGNVGTYKLGRASVRLADPVRIPAAMAAANAVMRGKGFTVETSRVSDESGRLVARQPNSNRFDRVVVTVEEAPGAVEIGVACEPFGDEEVARSIMDAILYRLGR